MSEPICGPHTLVIIDAVAMMAFAAVTFAGRPEFHRLITERKRCSR